MSLFSDYQAAINQLAEERRYKDQINYQNYLQSESNRQGTLKGLTNLAIGAGLGYAFPIAGLPAGKSALIGGGLGFIGGGNAMMLPYIFNKGGTPAATGSDIVSSGGGSIADQTQKIIDYTPAPSLGYEPSLNYNAGGGSNIYFEGLNKPSYNPNFAMGLSYPIRSGIQSKRIGDILNRARGGY